MILTENTVSVEPSATHIRTRRALESWTADAEHVRHLWRYATDGSSGAFSGYEL